jgi:hypothetical protein
MYLYLNKKLLKDEINNFYEINRIIEIYKDDNNIGKELLFGNEKDDVEETLQQRDILKTNPKKDRRNSNEKNKEKCIFF